MSKTTCSSFGDNEKVVVFHLEDTIVSFRKNEAVCLAVHGLGAESTGNKEHVASFELLETVWEFKETNLDASVLLRCNTFATASIVVCTWLFLGLGENRVPFSKLDLIVCFEVVELPANELVEVLVLGGCDKVTTPVSVDAHALQVSLAHGWEESQPVVGVHELRNFSLGNVQLLQDFVLCKGRFLALLEVFLVAASLATVDFALQTNGS